MKKLLAVLLCGFVLTQPLEAQQRGQNSIPPALIQAFLTRYTGATWKKWEFSEDAYRVKFNQDGKAHVSFFSGKGQWEKTERKIRWSKDLPAPVRAGWENSGYADWKIWDIKEVELPEGREYALHVSNVNLLDADHCDAFGEDHWLYFTPDGQLDKKD